MMKALVLMVALMMKVLFDIEDNHSGVRNDLHQGPNTNENTN